MFHLDLTEQEYSDILEAIDIASAFSKLVAYINEDDYKSFNKTMALECLFKKVLKDTTCTD